MKLGVIGYGRRIRKVINSIQKVEPSCKVTAITDIRNDELKKELGDDAADIHFYETPEAMIEQEKLDGLLIGTRDDTHAELACRVLPSGIPLFLEKPVATTIEDARKLKEAYEAANHDNIVVSFPLRVSPIMQCVKEILDSGKIGRVEHVQAVNNVPYGGNFFHGWMRDDSITGGLFIQKATHDIDYINYLIGFQPKKVCAMTSKQVLKGDKPAGLKCVDCDEQDTCEESQAHLGPDAYTRYCCFAEDTGNEDSGTAIIKYDTGMHVTYSQNFVVRKEAGYRGARFIGYKGTVEFNFKSKQVKVFMHHTGRVETYDVEHEGSHHGGDVILTKNFVDVMKGQAKSIATLDAGLLSVLTCIKAKESAQTETFKDIQWD